ncbi:calcineurin-like phosphoesterase C-terminal domain-containing protein [uncultured Tateyamaria sp.]|uniref:calcineurin-like phosphoesterase C-terminal domain-containing protein n=1 Tax=uncultured Tateyamaria sp. TaxID=455651 RepID=UPI002627BDE2|nr:calcineurin-like phosphoesterase C-terminal domain-containing protein [uncultured Tateyamaria sp.]
MQKYFLTTALSLLACSALAKDPAYIGAVETIRGSGDGADMARGTVFLDANRNSKLDPGETGLSGVPVSNGREVVLTGDDGTYALPAYDDMNLMVTKPAGYSTPVSADMVPQFAYIHKVEGSPDLRFGGIAPTGPLPEAINFPLIEDAVGPDFNCLVFGDAQAYTNREIGYVRDTAGQMLATSDLSDTECLIFAGDVMGDDLSLYPRFKSIIAVGQTPQYFVGGNHDIDFDAEDDKDSFDTFRREWGPEYYSFDIGDVHFVGLDNVRYPCNGVDPHPFCATDENHTYNGVITGRQLEWLANDLANVPEDKLIVLTAHIPFQTFTDNTAAKHQTDNLDELVAVLGDRPVVGLAGHTHTTENIEKGEHFHGWEENTNVGPAPFHQIIAGGLSGSWWAGDLNAQGVPHSTQRLGSPRGFYELAFNGPEFVDTYRTFHTHAEDQFHASFNTPRFREWADRLLTYRALYDREFDQTPPVVRRDLGDMLMLTTDDLAEGTWLTVNVWNGSASSVVFAALNGGEAMQAERTQSGTGEEKLEGVEYADPFALAMQSTQGSIAARSVDGGDETAGFTTWQGTSWSGKANPFQGWMLTDNSSHLWRLDMPTDLPVGTHTVEITVTDRHDRVYRDTIAFEVVEELPNLEWQAEFWE